MPPPSAIPSDGQPASPTRQRFLQRLLRRPQPLQLPLRLAIPWGAPASCRLCVASCRTLFSPCPVHVRILSREILSLPWAATYPHAPKECCRQYIFASATLYPHPRTGRVARHHLHETSMQHQFKDAVRKSDIAKRATCHTRHSFASCLLQNGPAITVEL